MYGRDAPGSRGRPAFFCSEGHLSGNRCQLNHFLEVYSQEFEIPEFFLGAACQLNGSVQHHLI